MRFISWIVPVTFCSVGLVACAIPGGESPEPEEPEVPVVVDAGGPCLQAVLPGTGAPCVPVDPKPEPEPELPKTAALATSRVVASGQSADEYTWVDASGRVRTAAFVDDAYRGGYIRRITYQLADGSTREASGGVDPSTGYQGFGYLVSHYDDGANSGASSSDSRDAAGHSSTLWQGKHHLLRSYTVDLHPRSYKTGVVATVHATVHWLVATGRSSLLFSVTYDSSDNLADSVLADSRAPYGAIAWDGAAGKESLAGVAWGDKYRFETNTASTGGYLTIASDWRYDQPNVVPFATAWTKNAEIGLVSTRTFALDVSGGDLGVWFDSSQRAHGSGKIAARCWQKTSATATNCADTAGDGATAKMPATWAWPFQMVNYGLKDQPTRDKKIAWGTNYGAVGWREAVSFDRTIAGYAKTSYSTHVVLGARSGAGVAGTIANEEAVRHTTLAATRGQIVLAGPKGIARTDIERYATPGYDPVYGVFRAQADAEGSATLAIDTTEGVLSAPMFVISASGSLPRSVSLDGLALVADVDYFVSTHERETWITLAQDLAGQHQLSVR